jgi:hypothetical protein
MQRDPKTRRQTASIRGIALYNMMLVEALSELLVEKGKLEKGEVLDASKN